MKSCIFCNIANKSMKSKILYEDDNYLAFEDTNPQAPVHFLIIPKQHIETIFEADSKTLGELLIIGADAARKKGLEADGFRTVINCKRHGGQTVYHLHAHVLGGRWFSWPPG
jgi:histidine triad (HIT) family protein